tara:strand:+ start:641 stop:850 length:210 start_codon:yes stop_codon:yes gene_type:complete
MTLDELKKLAGISVYDQLPTPENLSIVGNKKSQYMKKHNIKPGSDKWFKLWFAQPGLTGENPMPKSKRK